MYEETSFVRKPSGFPGYESFDDRDIDRERVSFNKKRQEPSGLSPFYKFLLTFVFAVLIAFAVLIGILWERNGSQTIKAIYSNNYTIVQSDLNKNLVFPSSQLGSITIPKDIGGWNGNIVLNNFQKDASITLNINCPYQLYIAELDHASTTPYTGIDIDGRVWFQSGNSQTINTLKVLHLNLGFVDGTVYIQGMVVNLDGLTQGSP